MEMKTFQVFLWDRNEESLYFYGLLRCLCGDLIFIRTQINLIKRQAKLQQTTLLFFTFLSFEGNKA